jgi:hypothetical protein
LTKECLDPTGFKLLWIPPTIKYYKPFAAYKNTDQFSKTIIFSSWGMVPRMISTLISYEAERLTIGEEDISLLKEKEGSRYYFHPRFPKPDKSKYQRNPRPRLVFQLEGSQVKVSRNMVNFCLLYPSQTLANIYNPQENIKDRLTYYEIRKKLKKRIAQLIDDSGIIEKYQQKNGDSRKWYWAAPLLLDKESEEFRSVLGEWFERENLKEFTTSTIDPENESNDNGDEKSAKASHFEEFKKMFFDSIDLNLGRKPAYLEDVLVDMVLGSPSICSLRSMNTYFNEDRYKNLTASFNIGLGFLTLYNKPESISIIRQNTRQREYWRKSLEYGMSGNIQSLIDEYIYLLYHCENQKESAAELSNQFMTTMNIRTSNVNVDSYDSFMNEYTPRMRCHYAVDFGTQKSNSIHGDNRPVSIRESFNSPFRPFVLASTSIGQEGLDFHYYCRKIMHWNLPSNAIDLEQREGRINRYKGFVIRKIVADKYLESLDQICSNIWDDLFSIAEKDRAEKVCDMIPFWHIESEKYKIERIVPLYPFSRDINKYDNLIKVLTVFRLTFGQPRQEELVEALLSENVNDDRLYILREQLMIDLSCTREL